MFCLSVTRLWLLTTAAKAACDPENCTESRDEKNISRISNKRLNTGKSQPIAGKEIRTEISLQLAEQSSELVCVSIDEGIILILIAFLI